MGWGHIKIFFSRTTGPIQTDLAQIILGGRGFKFIQTKGIALLQGEIIIKEKKCTLKFQKSFSPEPAGQNQSNLV
jgi:hypothetical protein